MAGQWVQVAFDEVKVIVKVATQGNGEAYRQWVTSYKVAVDSGGGLEYVLELDGTEKIFTGNTDADTVVENCVGFVQASSVRLEAVTWNAHISLRWEVYELPQQGTLHCNAKIE